MEYYEHERLLHGQGVQGHRDGAQDHEEDQCREQAHRDEEGSRGHPEGVGRGHGVLREAEALLRGRRGQLRGPRGAPEGGDPVPPGGPEDPQRRGPCLPAEEVSSEIGSLASLCRSAVSSEIGSEKCCDCSRFEDSLVYSLWSCFVVPVTHCLSEVPCGRAPGVITLE